MGAKKLIEENNRKRDMLTKENEKFYSDMLLYIRLQLSLSEQQSEEVLMEMLDHLLDGQGEGKTAIDIFGPDPKAYADEIIAQLPREEMRSVVPFILGIILNLISWLLIIRGIAILVISQFKDVDIAVFPLVVTGVALIILATMFVGVLFVFRTIKNSLFQEHSSEKKDSLKVGIFAAISMAIVMAVAVFTPKVGPSFEFSWLASLAVGAILWLITFFIKGNRR